MKKTSRLCLCLLLALALLCPAAHAADAPSSFDPSVFEGRDGFTRSDDGSWMIFKGIIFNEIEDKCIQLFLQADGDTNRPPLVRFLVQVTGTDKSSVTDFGTPAGIVLTLDHTTRAEIRLDDRYGNPACASVRLGETGVVLCAALADVNALSMDIGFDGRSDFLSCELTEDNIRVLRRTLCSLSSVLVESGIFSCTGADDASSILLSEIAEPTTEPTAEPTPEPTPEPTAEPAAESVFSDALKIGQIVTFGRYEQDNDPATEAEPIEWMVLEKKSYPRRRALLMAVRGLDAVSFGRPGGTEDDTVSGLCWENSYIRGWLNGEFFAAAFTEEEKNRILETDLITKDRTGAPKQYTTDRLFLLDGLDVRYLLDSKAARSCSVTARAASKLQAEGAVSQDGCARWWLRELVRAVRQGPTVRNEAGFVDSAFGLKEYYQGRGAAVSRNDLCAVRPVLWVLLTSP